MNRAPGSLGAATPAGSSGPHPIRGSGGAPGRLLDRKLPPVAEMAVGAMALVVVGGIYLASHLPKAAPLGPAVGLLAAAGALLLADVAVVSRISDFAWDAFFKVGGWALLAYVVIAGMLEYVFVLDHTRGSILVVITLMLLVFALAIPLLMAFSVARYQRPGENSRT
ncbi:MAG: hypothetical protein M0T79_13035 [Actinomycetota bacterium]|nr:hypothetical protein [Actinomycetota bacterium]